MSGPRKIINVPEKGRLLVGTVGKEEYKVYLEGQPLEMYRKMTKKEQDKFTTEMLHNIFYKLLLEGVIT